MKTKFYNHIVQLQKAICDEFEKIDGKARFFEDKWTRDGCGGQSDLERDPRAPRAAGPVCFPR